MNAEMTARQRRELDYHGQRAEEHARILTEPFSWEVLQNPRQRWWNAYWQMYAYILSFDLKDKEVLIVGCGFGDDALRLRKLGANVSAFDLSPDSLQIAKGLAAREGLQIAFAEMPAEKMQYANSQFDFIIARDIMHHVEIPMTMNEIVRVAKPGALLLVNEIYTHSITDRIRRSKFTQQQLYPRMQRFIYGIGKPYITPDERKLTEVDLDAIIRRLRTPAFFRNFNFLTTRIFPDRYTVLAKFDYLLLRLLRPIGWLLAGRVLFGARIDKLTDSDGNRIDISIESDGEPASDLNPKNRIVDN